VTGSSAGERLATRKSYSCTNYDFVREWHRLSALSDSVHLNH
jgi:hypothetical protein